MGNDQFNHEEHQRPSSFDQGMDLELTLDEAFVSGSQDEVQQCADHELELETLLRENQIEDKLDASAPGLKLVAPSAESDAEELYRYGCDCLARGDWLDAIQPLQDVAIVAENDELNANAYARIGYAQYRLGKPEDAIQSYQRALEKCSGLRVGHVGLAAALHRSGAIEEAVEQYQLAAHLSREQPVVYLLLGHLYHRLGRLHEAQAAYREVLNLSPDHPLALLNLGVILAINRQYKDSLPLLERVAALQPQNWRPAFDLAVVLGRLQRWNEAIDVALDLCRREPDQMRFRILAARLLRCGGRPFEVIGLLGDCEEMGDLQSTGLELIGLVHEDLGNPSQSLVFWQQALKLNPNKARIHVHIARQCLREQELDMAMQSIEKALEINDARANTWVIRGHIELADQRTEAAIQSLEKAISCDENHQEAHYWLGRAYLAGGKVIGAIQQAVWLEEAHSPHAVRLRQKIN